MRNEPRRVLFSACDGPEGIEIYTSEHGAIVDFVNDFPALYIEVDVSGASVQLGPFHCSSIRKYFERAHEAFCAPTLEEQGA